MQTTLDRAVRDALIVSVLAIAVLACRTPSTTHLSLLEPPGRAERSHIDGDTAILVNGRRVNVPSFRCRVGDLVEVKEKGKQMTLLLEAIKSAERDVPDYIEVDHNKMTAKLARVPAPAEVPYPVMMEPHLVVEFYSR